MSKKICVYAIAKNEEKFAARWANSMSEADEIFVLDTGSTDATVQILSAFPKVKVVSEKIEPWRFDTARNRSLSFVSKDADLCVSTDLDEVFEPGWRNILENAIKNDVTRVKYRYTWNFNPDGTEGTVFFADKFHIRTGYKWVYPVHEVLTFTGEGQEKYVLADGLRLYHKADDTKSRSQYLELLELSVKEAPDDDRNMHYLGREYMFKGRYDDAVKTLKNHLKMKKALWKDERSASMRYIAQCLAAQSKNAEAVEWFLRSCAEAPFVREPWMAFAAFCFNTKNYNAVIPVVEKALTITQFTESYLNEASSWNETPFDLLSLAYYFTGNKKKALYYCDKALEIKPNDDRILKNREYFIE